MFKMLAPLVALFCCTANVHAGYLLLDDFVEGPMEIAAGNAILDDSGQPIIDAQLRLFDLSTVVGGTRLLQLVDVVAGVGSGEFSSRQVTQTVDPADGVQRVTGTQGAEEILIGYGARESPMNLDLSADAGVVVTFSSYRDDDPEDLKFLVLSLISAFDGDLASESYGFELPAYFSGGDMFLSFTPLAEKVDMTDIDSIVVEVNLSTGDYSYEIDRIAIVPEPNPVSGTGIVLLALMMSHIERQREG